MITTSIAAETLTRIRSDRFSFCTADDVKALAADNATRLTQCLVRCGGCRFIAAAQDVATMIRAIESIGDYVRDVSLVTDQKGMN